MSEEARPDSALAMALFGPFEVRIEGRALPRLRSKKTQWLLALLTLQQGRELPRAWLAGSLWPENTESQGRAYLRQRLTELRRWLGPEAGRLRSPTPQTLCLDLAGVEVDLFAFDAAFARAAAAREHPPPAGPGEGAIASSLTRAVALYRGPLLEGCEEAWLLPEREAREQAYLQAREWLAAHATERGAPAERADRATGRQGDGAKLPETLSRPVAIPRPLSPLVGRTAELGEVLTWLRNARLVTLTGAGGVGKTRLAIQVAEAAAAGFAHGVWFVDLSTLADPALVPQTVARALGVREEPGSPPTATLQSSLGSRQLLLVLDNCEHLLRACARLAEALLSAAPHLRLLTTSRQPLGLTGEIVWRVPSLSLPPGPDPGGECPVPGARRPAGTGPVVAEPGTEHRAPSTGSVATLLQFDAVRLFVERAQAAVPAFALTEQNAPATVQLCRRLDGIPLAIELAAARLKALSVEQIAARLDDRFRLLTGGSRTAPPRQQTLRAALDWSYELLPEPERVLLRRLTIFAGGFTLEAAEAVCTESAPRLLAAVAPEGEQQSQGTDVIDLLGQLIDKSLVWMEQRGAEACYRLLETTREYAREKLAEAGEAAGVRRRHGDWYLQLAERAELELQGPHQGPWLERLDAEHHNLRAALECFLESAPECALRLAAALARFWEARSHLEEGRQRLAAALDRAGPWRRTPIGAAALDGAGVLAFHQGDYAAARVLYGESLEIRRQLGDRRGIARSLGHLGRLANDQGDCPAARSLLEESLTIERELGDRAGLATALADLAHVAYYQGNVEAARSLYEESLATGRELGDRARIATALGGLGEIVCRHGEHAVARSLYEESLALRRALGDRCGVADSLGALGNVATKQGDYAAARSYLEEALAIGRELGDRPVVAGMLDLLGNLARRQKEYREARRLLEECLTLWRALGARTAVMHALGALGHLAREQGEHEQARAFYRESLLLRQEVQDTNALIAALEDFAELAAAEGEWARMTRLLGAALAQRAAAGRPPTPRWRAATDGLLRGACSALAEEAFAAVWAEGQAMALEQAVIYALEQPDTR